MAQHLARIHGTEEDKVNCPFYFKIGACRHSDRCSRLHHKPQFSPTLLIKHLYQHPVRQAELQQAGGGGGNASSSQQQPSAAAAAANNTPDALDAFLCFYEDMYCELSKFGRIDELHVVDNLGDHMIGHVYVKFCQEEDASDALEAMQGRYYDGRLMQLEFSPVTDFREARCRDYDEDVCSRGGFCNFLHAKPVPMCLIRQLEDDCERERRRKHQQQRYEAEQQQQQQRRSGGGGGGSSSGRSSSRKRKKDHHRSSRRSKRRHRSGSGSGGNDDGHGDGDDDSRSSSSSSSSASRRSSDDGGGGDRRSPRSGGS